MSAKSFLVRLVFVAQLVLLLSVGATSAHYLIPDSVNDETGEIRWKDYTRYDGARKFAIGQCHRPAGIRPPSGPPTGRTTSCGVGPAQARQGGAMFPAEYAKIDPIEDPIVREAGGKR